MTEENEGKLTGTILVVDDQEPMRNILKTILAQGGHDVTEAENGEEALSRLAEKEFDLVLLDIEMPGIDGIETCRRIKADVKTKMLPVIMVTSLDDPETKLRALKSGADEFLAKPAPMAELTVRIRNMLRIKVFQDQMRALNAGLENELSKLTNAIEEKDAQEKEKQVDKFKKYIQSFT